MNMKTDGTADAGDSLKPQEAPVDKQVLTFPHLLHSKGGTVEVSGGTEKDAKPDETNPANLLPYAQGVHQYVNEYIRFADTKAAFLFAFVSGVIGFLFSKEMFIDINICRLFNLDLFVWLAFLGTLGLVVAGIFSFLVIKPQLFPRKQNGLIFWETVANYLNAKTYTAEVLALTDDGIVAQLIDHTYQLSLVARNKYRWLAWGIWSAGLATLLWSLALIIGSADLLKGA